jgi:putative transposase
LVRAGCIAFAYGQAFYRRHRFPSIVIQQAVWLYFRFALSYRDVEDMLAERGIEVYYETVRRWALSSAGSLRAS